MVMMCLDGDTNLVALRCRESEMTRRMTRSKILE